MPIRYSSPEELEAERQQDLLEKQERNEIRDARYEQELKLARLDAAVKGRHATLQRCVVGFYKAFSIPLALICITVLTIRHVDIPDTLERFLTL